MNPAAEHIFGYTAAELSGKHANAIVPESTRPLVDGILHRLAGGDLTAHSVNENLTKDGRIILCEWTNTPLRDANGVFLGFLSMVHDITERKQVEEQLIRNQKTFSELVERAPFGIYAVDSQFRVALKTGLGDAAKSAG
jgi:PAS domain S-box-containing protein